MISLNPNGVSNGLVFAMDANNRKSYKGPALANVLTSITQTGISDNGSSYRAFAGTEDVYIPTVGNFTGCKYVDWYNDYPTSGNCCPSFYSYGSSLPVTGSTVYTYAILYRSVNRYTNANLMYHYEYNGGTYLTEFGVHGVGAYSWQETSLGNGWYWSSAKFTTQPSTTLLNTGSWMYQYATWNRLYVAAVMIVAGDYTQLHPIYWPTVGTTRGNAAVFSDITGNNTLNAVSLTYSSSGNFNFSGAGNYIDCGNATVLQQSGSITMAAWVNPSSWGGLGNIMSKNANSGYRFRLDSAAGALWWYVSGNSIQGGNCPLNTWSYCVVTGNSSGLCAYVNGVLVASNSTPFAPSAPQTGNMLIGTYGGAEYFQGQIASASVYNRALTANEVAQNFNASRGRYGI